MKYEDKRLCCDPDCRGDCTWCNRAEVENQVIVNPLKRADPALQESIRRIQQAQGNPLAEDARRVLRAYEAAQAQLQKSND